MNSGSKNPKQKLLDYVMEHKVSEFIIITIDDDLQGDFDYDLKHPGPGVFNLELLKAELLNRALFGGPDDDTA